jgi:hypothetical protein
MPSFVAIGRTQGQTACFRTRTSYPLWALLLAQSVVEHRTENELVNDFVVVPLADGALLVDQKPGSPHRAPLPFSRQRAAILGRRDWLLLVTSDAVRNRGSPQLASAVTAEITQNINSQAHR